MRADRVAVLAGWVLAIGLTITLGCGPASPSPVAPAPSASGASSSPSRAASAPPPEGAVASLRTGELPPIERDPVRATPIAHFADDRFETIALEVVLPLSGAFDWSERVGCRVSIDHPGSAPYAFAAIPEDVSAVEGHGLAAATIWVRRPREQEGQPVAGIVFTPQLGFEPGQRVRFVAEHDAKTKSDPRVVTRWAAALATHLRELGKGPWNEFAAGRVEDVFGTKKKAGVTPRNPHDVDEMARLMETTTGVLSIQEALQHDRPLLLATSKEKRAVPIDKLSPPRSAPHPWDELLRASRPPPPEPLADAVPAEFWYLRASDLSFLFRIADELDAWGTPAANLMDRSLEERDLARRYETQLGVVRTALGRALGPEVVESVALTGSDPYFREGSDVTAVFKVRQPAIFGAALDGMLAVHAKAHVGAAKTSVTYGTTNIAVVTSPDGALRQHRASMNGLEIISNSLAAIKRVLDTLGGKHARLGDEKDFRYMLARDANELKPALLFFGDRFVAEVIGPRQKVLEARRQLATAELMTPGFAALLYGWLYGKSPASTEELIASKLLHKGELKHGAGAAIAWRPGEPARSSWGTPSALSPLIELPSPETVTESERAAYERFSRTYETYWSRYIDPAMLRLGTVGPKAESIAAELRVLPLIEGTDYNDILELAGQARVKAPLVADGVRAVVGIGPNAGLRRELSGLATGALGRHAFKLDFLGDWAMVGLADRTRIADVAQKLGAEIPQKPEAEPTRRIDEVAEAARLPVYAAVEIRSASGGALALAAIRKMADETLRGMLFWNDVGVEHGTTVFRVAIGRRREVGAENPQEERPELSVFYALTDKAFLLSLDEGVLRKLVSDLAEGRGPVADDPGKSPTGGRIDANSASQLVFDLAGEREGGLFTVLAWLFSEQLVRASSPSRARAEAVLRGAPERAGDPAATRSLAFAYFGAAPTPPYGGVYTLATDGLRDPALGSANAPRWPPLPVPGSTVDKVLGAIGRFRSEVAFDSEGHDPRTGRAMQSLHLRATIGLREP